MTPEERLFSIEHAIQRTADLQVENAEQIRSLIADGEKQNEAIRSLIVVSRTVLTSIQELRAAQDKMIEEARELNKHTEEKLNILIDTVDRIIRDRKPDGGRN